MYIPGWHLSSNTPVQVKEIRLVNKKPEPKMIADNSVLRVVSESDWIPDNMKIALYKVINFYSFNYDTSGSWQLLVSGCYLDPEPGDLADLDIDIKVNSIDAVTQSMSSRGKEESNFHFFTAQAHNIASEITSIEVQWHWQGKNNIQV